MSESELSLSENETQTKIVKRGRPCKKVTQTNFVLQPERIIKAKSAQDIQNELNEIENKKLTLLESGRRLKGFIEPKKKENDLLNNKKFILKQIRFLIEELENLN